MIEKLTIKNWKRFTELDHRFDRGLNLVIGPNGIGKTSVLEGIRYALFDRGSATELINHSADEATVGVTLTTSRGPVGITRGLSRDGKVTERISGVDLAGTSVSSVLSDLYHAHPAFLERLLVMSEGDIYRYTEESGRLENQLSYLLPVDSLQAAISRIPAALKPLRKAQKTNRSVLKEGRNLEADLQAELKKLKAERVRAQETESSLRERLKPLREEAGRLKELKRREQDSQEWWDGWHTFSTPLAVDTKEGDPDSLLVFLESEVNRSQEAKTNNAAQAGRVEGELACQTLLRDALSKPSDVCPLCESKLTPAHQAAALQRQEVREQELREQLKSLKRISSELETSRVDADQRLRQARQLLQDRPETEVSPVESDQDSLDKELAALEGTEIDARADVQRTTERIAAIEENLQAIELDKSIESQIISAYRHDALLTSLNDGANRFISDLRDSVLRPLTEELGRQWKNYRPGIGWTLDIDGNGLLCVRQGSTTRSYSSLSGGEKAVAIVLLRLALTAALTEADFIVLDEPFEHLDPRSRRILLSTLSQAIDSEVIGQIIVSTYEEPVVRRLLHRDSVTTLFVPSD